MKFGHAEFANPLDGFTYCETVVGGRQHEGVFGPF